MLPSVLLVALMYAGIAEAQKYLYHVPWACSVLHESGELVSACSILDVNNVLVSADSLMERIRSPNYPPKQYFQNLGELTVYAGTNYMNPMTKFSKPLANAQDRKVGRFIVAFKSPKDQDSSRSGWEIKTDPKEISASAGAEFDAVGLAFGVGILVVREPFTTSPYVMPMLIRSPDIQQNTGSYIRMHENTLEAPPLDTCLTYSWNRKLNRIRYHVLMYLPSKNCRELFCHWKIANCTEYPGRGHLRCFKSVKYADVCPNARGAAIYCGSFDKSVFGILTVAPSCGQKKMPGVYTTTSKVIEFFEKVFFKPFDYASRTDFDVFSLPQKNTDYEGIQ